MVFTRPGQIIEVPKPKIHSGSSGWTLIFHPDLIRGSELGRKIGSYSFFSYETHEALHLSDHEQTSVTDLIQKIQEEYTQNLDRHSHDLMVNTLGLLLDYCTRYYDRQFFTRTLQNRDIVSRFEALLIDYFEAGKPVEIGVPTVSYCGEALNMSAHYLSDLLKKETGKSALEHIHFHLIDRAKNHLLASDIPVGQVAYDLGFNYPNHFSKLFKAKTGMSPVEYRAQHQTKF
ncbi:helix-turn-helix domain-containing protein [Pontibacter sp. G13]|uniref:helix-turn-helix domain-containing protein n=1 Tax=Pontibacter sp. G13 TaxID=3074898 RepID=UPI0039058B76